MRRTRFQKNHFSSAIVTLALFILSACGGGGGSVAGGGIGGTGVIASGSVTAKGSIHVNGVVYDISGAAITFDGIPGDDSHIRRGMVVRVNGKLDSASTGVADSVRYEGIVQGLVTSSSTQPADIVTLTVLGQTVIVEEGFTYVDDGTIASPNPLPRTLPDFSTVSELEVSGFRDASGENGAIRATYIEIRSGLSEYEVKGVVENAAIDSFEISGLTVTTDSATIGLFPANGDFVEVKGASTNFGSDSLLANSIEIKAQGLDETEVERAEIEGFVDNLDNPVANQFTLDGQPVDYSGTTFEAGTANDLAEGIKVEAEGSVTGGVLVAEKIKFKESIRIEGNAIDDDLDGSFSIEGLSSLTIFVDPGLTSYEGFPTATQVIAGDHLEIRGREFQTTGNVLATEIRFRDVSDSRVELQGPVTAFSQSESTVELLETITVDTSDPFVFQNSSEQIVSREIFYSILSIGDLVKARGDLVGAIVSWTEIEHEDE